MRDSIETHTPPYFIFVSFVESLNWLNLHYRFENTQVARRINNEIEDIDPSISIISEPGQYYATSAYTLVSLVHTKKVIRQADGMVRMYYMNCGVFNGFIEEMLNLKERLPIPVYKVELLIFRIV